MSLCIYKYIVCVSQISLGGGGGVVVIDGRGEGNKGKGNKLHIRLPRRKDALKVCRGRDS